jgi:sugar phosphate isomerase/epimerase
MVRAWVLGKGFRGWVSIETFDRRMRDKNVEVEECAERAERSMERLQKALDLPKSSL